MSFESVRKLFPVTERWAYLNHCAVSPLATPVAAAMQRQVEDQRQNGVTNVVEWHKASKAARQKAATLINAKVDEIAFARNTVEGISYVAEGLEWNAGDNVVTVNGEYPANVYPWFNLRAKGVETRMVADRDGRVILDDLFAAVDGKTKLIALSFVEFTNGFRNDVAAVGEFCRERGVLYLVDAVQALGVLPVDVEAAKVDFLAAGAQKWLLGPPGIGVFYCRAERLDLLRVSQVGPASMVTRSEFLPYDFKLKPNAQRFEPGAQNYAGIFGLEATIDILLKAGIANIEKHVLELLDIAVEGLRAKGCEVLSSLRPEERSSIIAFRSPKVAPADLEARLKAANVAISTRSGGTRVAPHLYNNREDVERLLEVVP